MIHLLVPFYVDARQQRNEEIRESVRKNAANTAISFITLFCEKGEMAAATALVPKSSGSVVALPRRAIYDDLLRWKKSDVVVVANADIYFDDTIALAEHIAEGQVVCLTRAEQRPFGEGLYWPEADTGLCHDAWIFRPPLKISGQYEFGRPGCEMRFAGECEKAGYALFNPCRQIHAIHHHASGLRNYSLWGSLQVGSPYAHVYVTPEWPIKPPVKKPPPVPPVDATSRKSFVRQCIAAQLSGLWTNCNIDSMMQMVGKQVTSICDMAEKVASEAERRGLLP